MFKVREQWAEMGDDGRIVTRTRVDFGSIQEQLVYLRRMVDVWRGMEWTRQKAMKIIREANCEDRNKACYALEIAKAVQHQVRYVNELPETFQVPRYTWDHGFGDCDDHSTLIASLIESLGIRVDLVGMKVRGEWKHVFPRALIPSGGRELPMPLDTTLKGVPVRDVALLREQNPIARAQARGWDVETFIAPRLS